MTVQHDQLKREPQMNINRGDLSLEERSELRMLQVQGAGTKGPNFTDTFTAIFYLEGDERQAAEMFVEENREQLETIDFSKRDIIQQSLSRDLYDWILHFLGERELRKYRTVVLETRSDGTCWVMDRDHFETNPVRRYSIDKSARVDGLSLEELYDEFETDTEITEGEIEAHDAVSGVGRQILEYYRVAGLFDCKPTTVGGELAVRKHA